MRVPLRHSLLTRLVAASVLIVVLAVAATAWLAVRTATRALQAERGQSLVGEQTLYQDLVGYAAVHRSWAGVGPLLQERAMTLGRRITLTTEQGHIVADSEPGAPLDSTSPFATIDPLRLDRTLTGQDDPIDARAVGPYKLSAGEAASARRYAEDVIACLQNAGVTGDIVSSPSGHPVVETAVGGDPKGVLDVCTGGFRDQTMPTEQEALRELARLTGACLGRSARAVDLSIQPNWSTIPPTFSAMDGARDPVPKARLEECLEQARRAQLEPYTARAGLLFVTDPNDGRSQVTFALSGRNISQIITVTAGVFLVASLAMILIGRRLVKPLRALARGADEERPVVVPDKGEIGQLATTLNDATRRRDQAEAQRKAMVGDVAHELRNPLANIRGWLEAAQDGLVPIDANLVDLLSDEASMLGHTLDDLADLAASDAGTLRIHPEPVDLDVCLTQVIETYASAARAAGLRLEYDAPAEVTFAADAMRLRQLLGNLVSNAIRYTPPGGVIQVLGSIDGDVIQVQVKDTGIGIAAGDLAKVFDRFWRADESRARVTGGSGLGLAIARQLASAHGGTLDVESRPGAGTTFTMRIPAEWTAF